MTTVETRTSSGAHLSSCQRYRFELWRSWGDLQVMRRVVFIMLNPSVADARVDDPTIRRCIGFAKRWAANRLRVVNLFALRATDPRGLLKAGDPVGPTNDTYIETIAGRDCDQALHRDIVVCAWGSPSDAAVRRLIRARVPHVRNLLLNRDLQCLGRAQDGSPRHPLRLSYDTPLEPWRLG